jgi:hypothetical protein
MQILKNDDAMMLPAERAGKVDLSNHGSIRMQIHGSWRWGMGFLK